MGTPDFAVASLRRLVEGGYNVVAAVTMPDKPAGRGLKMRESAVKQYAAQAGLPILQPERLKNPDFIGQLEALEPDLGIVIAFRMLPEAVWALPRLGTFNLHASLLPQYRGAAPINRAIMNGEKETGVTTFMLNAGIDTGAILGVRHMPILDDDTAGTLHDKLMDTGAELVAETVDAIASGSAAPEQQPENDRDLKPAPKIFKEDCLIRWDRSPGEIYDFVRGLSPHPAAWAYLMQRSADHVTRGQNTQGETLVSGAGGQAEADATQVRIFSATPEESGHSDRPGAIATDGKSYLKVACRGGWIAINELQPASKKRMSVAEFLRGCRDLQNLTF